MKKFLILAGGWIVTLAGAVVTSLPVPMPFPVGITLFLAGCAILTAHSKAFRRGVQYLRHHHAWLSQALDSASARAPARVRALMQRTRPLAFGRRARIRARGDVV